MAAERGASVSEASSDERALPDAIRTTARAINLCLSNKFLKAQKLLEPCAKDSMYHALGYGTIMYLQAVMTFEPQAIQQACESIKLALDVCDKQRHKNSWTESLSSWIWTPSFEKITEEQRHAELCYAECLLQRALLTFIQDENLISFIRGALKIKQCYDSYRACHSMVVNQSEDLAKSPQNKDFEGGVHLGIGSFNLLLSLLPTRLLKVLEFIGFSGDQALGLEHLDKGCKGESLRAPMCAMILLTHHTVMSYYFGIGDGDVEYADEILQPFIKTFPKGAIFLYFAGRIRQVQGRLEEAEERYMYSIKVQSEWKQFHHICYWELMWCYSFQNNWPKAYHYAAILLRESNWSKTSYMYMKASFKFMAKLTNQPIPEEDDTSEENSEKYMFSHLSDYKQRIAGKSIPFEKYSIHKATKYFSQENWLFLPGLELIYMFNGFHILRRCSHLARQLLDLVHKEQEELETRKDEKYYVDDWCLGKILEGMCYQCIKETDKALQSLLAAVERGKDTVLDKHFGAFACAEVGFLFLDQGKYAQAKRYLKTASHEYQGYFLESRLHFRIHAGLCKLKKIEKERKRAKKLAKSTNSNTATSADTLSDMESDDSDEQSNYNTASEGEEDAFEDACTERGADPTLPVNHVVDGPSKSRGESSRKNNNFITHGEEPHISHNSSQHKKSSSKHKGKEPKPSQNSSHKKVSQKLGKGKDPKVSQSSSQHNGSQPLPVYHETAL